ncbi:delta24-sterol reductase [Sporothrix brasiliensis 5110]|uniref:Delta(24)-sterol reductase n=1 Tax=Sporothrix brasiliensis 5110 TaxID=1398154 RepID=A0A0C2F5M7_9PEZI|nr:delta24-sterol reductase [Sporothrix brasiliensis 5110]KIH86343.1 delta24-sterol reductase [Sporothrix brasiliensis 5110]
MDAHKKTVATIAATVRQFFARREPYRIFHGSTNSTRPRTAATGHTRSVDISALGHVLQVDKQARTALVEPNVPMDRLVAATLPHGLVPPVVMEFPGITAGGGYAGTAGESSSFRHGFFDRTINRVEMVLANGEVVEATPSADDKRRDLFKGAAGALGTLGITTLMELRLVPARNYVRTTYHRCNSVAETIQLIREKTDMATAQSKNKKETNASDYVDGILFSKDHGVVVTGEMTDDEPPPGQHIQTFSHPRDPWFYLHVQDRTSSSSSSPSSPSSPPVVEYIPLAEYLFRYDRGGFWVGRSAFSYFPFPFNKWTRWFLDDFLHTRMLYKALHASGQSATYIVQDLALPYRTAEAFVDYTAETFGIWPLWLCPLQAPEQPTFHPHEKRVPETGPSTTESNTTTSASSASSSSSSSLTSTPTSTSTAAPSASASSEPLLNIGLWGRGPAGADADRCVALNRDLEHRLAHHFGGMKWFYAHAYYDEDLFWKIYDKPAYDALRTKYHATTLPSVYDKIKVNTGRNAASGAPSMWKTRWPFAAFYGLRQAIKSKAYLPRTPPWRE